MEDWPSLGPSSENLNAVRLELVDRIELSTSPLPRECSTTELHEPNPTAGGSPLGDVLANHLASVERETGFEPATFSLGS